MVVAYIFLSTRGVPAAPLIKLAEPFLDIMSQQPTEIKHLNHQICLAMRFMSIATSFSIFTRKTLPSLGTNCLLMEQIRLHGVGTGNLFEG